MTPENPKPEPQATPAPTPEDRAALRVKNPDAPDNFPAKTAAAVGGKRVEQLRALMNESLMNDKLLLVLTGKDDAAWGVGMLAAAMDYLMGCGLSHDEMQGLVTRLWEGSIAKVREFNAVVDKAVAEGVDPVAALEAKAEAEQKTAVTDAAPLLAELLQHLVALKAEHTGKHVDPDFGVPTLPALRTKDGKEIIH